MLPERPGTVNVKERDPQPVPQPPSLLTTSYESLFSTQYEMRILSIIMPHCSSISITAACFTGSNKPFLFIKKKTSCDSSKNSWGRSEDGNNLEVKWLQGEHILKLHESRRRVELLRTVWSINLVGSGIDPFSSTLVSLLPARLWNINLWQRCCLSSCWI